MKNLHNIKRTLSQQNIIEVFFLQKRGYTAKFAKGVVYYWDKYLLSEDKWVAFKPSSPTHKEGYEIEYVTNIYNEESNPTIDYSKLQ